jgi:hypothetical protein
LHGELAIRFSSRRRRTMENVSWLIDERRRKLFRIRWDRIGEERVLLKRWMVG